MNIISCKNKGKRVPLLGYNKMDACPAAHTKYRGYTPLFSALALLLSIALLSACPDDADNNNNDDNNSGSNTPTEFAYTCDNGTAVEGSTTDQDAQQNCASCDENYIPHAINGTTRQACTPTFEVLSNGVTIICPGIEVDGTFVIDGTTYTKRSRATITTDNAANTCTTGITDMSSMFFNASTFNEDIGHWDVSMVSDMSSLFFSALAFDQDIGHWDVSMVSDMNNMFSTASAFNQDIGDWNVSMVSDMSSMFQYTSAFNQDIGGWDVSMVSTMISMFSDTSAFNTDIGDWDVSMVSDMSFMFTASVFNQDIGDWNVSMVSDMQLMFNTNRVFNQDLSRWCVSKISGKPSGFDYESPIQSVEAHAPRWGTCPSS